MIRDELEKILQALADGRLAVSDAVDAVGQIGGADLGCARIDHQREQRCGFPEVIYGAGKTPEQVLTIAEHFVECRRNLLITRISSEAAARVLRHIDDAHYDPLGRTLHRCVSPAPECPGQVVVVCAGTSDLPVANECGTTLTFLGIHSRLIADVGVAGLHRLLARRKELEAADLLIVIAGMEGALPSVIGGLVPAPLIAVPTSVGYGVGTQGIAALLGMLSSCAAGITVVNIDNGFGAACAARRILGRRHT